MPDVYGQVLSTFYQLIVSRLVRHAYWFDVCFIALTSIARTAGTHTVIPAGHAAKAYGFYMIYSE